MGSPFFALPSLQKLHDNFHENIKTVFTQPDQPKGRGLCSQQTAVKKLALSLGLNVFSPSTKEELTNLVTKINPNLIIVVAYGMILPKSITDTYFCLNIHPSILPKYRGATPIQSALINQNQDTGITFIKMNEKMDQGPILWQTKIAIENKNFGELETFLAERSADELITYLNDFYFKNKINLVQQDESLATYCKKICTTDCNLNSAKTPEEFIAIVKAFNPKPGAYLTYEGKRYKILSAHLENNEVKIDIIQPEGKKPMNFTDFLLGNRFVWGLRGSAPY